MSNLTETCQQAIEQWGTDFQLDMAIEEASELIKAVCKLKRNGFLAMAIISVAEEIADTEIMLEQLKIMLDCRKDVNGWKKYKLERLAQKIEEAKAKNEDRNKLQ